MSGAEPPARDEDQDDDRWTAVRTRSQTPGAHDAVIAALFALGSQGVQEEGDAVLTQFPPATDVEAIRSAILAADASADVVISRAAPVDWTEGWKGLIGAHTLDGLTVTPPWLAAGRDPARTVVIDPGMAFGTGDHPSTRGAIRLMQGAVRAGDVVADLGAGSAVLSIAAVKLGAARVAAVELDPDAIANAEANVRANGVDGRVVVIEGDAELILPLVAPVRVALANIISSVIVGLLPSLTRAVSPDGVLILAGILHEERARMLEALETYGWRADGEDVEDVWWSVRATRIR